MISKVLSEIFQIRILVDQNIGFLHVIVPRDFNGHCRQEYIVPLLMVSWLVLIQLHVQGDLLCFIWLNDSVMGFDSPRPCTCLYQYNICKHNLG